MIYCLYEILMFFRKAFNIVRILEQEKGRNLKERIKCKDKKNL